MPTYGQHPSDVVQDSRGNALSGVLLQFYLTEAEARWGTSPVGSAVSDEYGTWEFTTTELDLWTRLPNGRVWQVAHSDADVVAAAQAAQAAAESARDNAASIGATKLDTSAAATTYATKTEVTDGLAAKANSADVAATYETKANVTSGLAAKLDSATAAATYETKANVTSGLAAKLDSAAAASTYETKANVTSGLAGKVSKGDLAVLATDYGVVANGTTDDRAALLSALNAGPLVILPKNGTIRVAAKLVVPTGRTIITNGASFVVTGALNDYAIQLQSATTVIGGLRLDTPTGADVRGVEIAGDDITVDRLVVTAASAAAGAGDINDCGLSIRNSKRVELGQTTVTNFDFAAQVKSSSDIDLGRVRITTYQRGLYISDVVTLTASGRITGASPNAAVSPGHNGVLIDATANSATGDLDLRGITVSDAGEHGFRIGGSFRVKRVHFTACAAVNVGGCGFKVLGDSVNKHEDITLTDCVVEDAAQSGTNGAGFMLQYVRRVKVNGAIVRKSGKTYSASEGFNIQGADFVTVNDPDVSDTFMSGYAVLPNLGNNTNVRLNDGRITSTSGNGVLIDYTGATFRRVCVEGWPNIDMSGSGYSVSVTNTGGTGAVTGPAWLCWQSVSAAAGQVDPAGNVSGYLSNVRAPFSAPPIFKAGSQWVDSSLRVSDGSTWVVK